MANNSYASICTAINTDIAAVTQVEQVTDSRSIDISLGFPFCRFYLDKTRTKNVDNQPSDEIWYDFALELWQETTNKTKTVAEADGGAASEAIIKKFLADWQLKAGGSTANCDNSMIQDGPVGLREGPQGPCTVHSMHLSVMTLNY